MEFMQFDVIIITYLVYLVHDMKNDLRKSRIRNFTEGEDMTNTFNRELRCDVNDIVNMY